VKVQRASRYERNPNVPQRILLAKHAAAARCAYNWGLQQGIERYPQSGLVRNAKLARPISDVGGGSSCGCWPTSASGRAAVR
jgi:hypothetical protein